MRILFLSRWYPHPPNNGAKIRVLNIIRELSREHDISLVAFADSAVVGAEALQAMSPSCSRVRVVPYRPFRPRSVKALIGLCSPRPRSLVDTFNPAMQAAIAAETRDHDHDLVIASEIDMVPYAARLRGLPLVLEDLELAAYRDQARQEGGSGAWAARLRWWKLGRYLRRVLPRFSACTVVSELERANLHALVPGYQRVHVVPNAVDLAHYAGAFGEPRPNTLIFSGALGYRANHDALAHFLSHMHGRIARAVPDLLLSVTGSTSGIDLGALPAPPGLRFTGYVDDVRPLIAGSWASVVPLRVGGGTRLKILEAMALGTPVVSTRKGAEGLAVTHGEDILLADDPAAFSIAVVQLLRSPELRARLAAGGARLVASQYDWRVVGQDLRRLIDEIVARRAA